VTGISESEAFTVRSSFVSNPASVGDANIGGDSGSVVPHCYVTPVFAHTGVARRAVLDAYVAGHLWLGIHLLHLNGEPR
jgi:hypothetical protein